MPRPKPDRPRRRYHLELDAAVAEALDRLAAERPNFRGDPSPSNAVAWLLEGEEIRRAAGVAREKEGE